MSVRHFLRFCFDRWHIIEMHSFGWAWTTSIVRLLSSFILIEGYDWLLFKQMSQTCPHRGEDI